MIAEAALILSLVTFIIARFDRHRDQSNHRRVNAIVDLQLSLARWCQYASETNEKALEWVDAAEKEVADGVAGDIPAEIQYRVFVDTGLSQIIQLDVVDKRASKKSLAFLLEVYGEGLSGKIEQITDDRRGVLLRARDSLLRAYQSEGIEGANRMLIELESTYVQIAAAKEMLDNFIRETIPISSVNRIQADRQNPWRLWG